MLSVIAPHICKGCGGVGAVLCERCVFNILQQKCDVCAVCGRRSPHGNLCARCRAHSPFAQLYAVGWRQTVLLRLLDDFKFNSERAAAQPIAKLLDVRLPELAGFTVVPVPTAPAHVRQRGFGHAELVARRLARTRHMQCVPDLLARQTNVSQHFLNARERQAAAAQAFALNRRRKLPDKILLVDDIWTTGATLSAAARLLKSAGAQEIIGAVAAVQPKK